MRWMVAECLCLRRRHVGAVADVTAALLRHRTQDVVRSSRQHLKYESAQQIILSEHCVGINTSIPRTCARAFLDSRQWMNKEENRLRCARLR
jgi:hypothetical protein